MTKANRRPQLFAKLEPFGQEHLLQFWDELDSAERTRLADQIDGIDLEQIAALFAGDVDQPDWAALSRQAAPTPAVRLKDRERGSAGELGIEPAAARGTSLGVAKYPAITSFSILLMTNSYGTRDPIT